MTKHFHLMAIVAISVTTCLVMAHSKTQEIRIPAGKTVDLWFGVNVTGKVFYAIRTKDNINTIHMWWILEPTGQVEQLGKRSNDGHLDIPGLLKGTVSAKLRASATVDTVVYVSENVAVDHVATFHW